MNLVKLILSCFAAYTAGRQLEIAEERLRIYRRETAVDSTDAIEASTVEITNE